MAFSFPLDGPGSAFRCLTQFLNIVRTHQDRSAAVMLSPASKVVYYALMATGLSAPQLAAVAEMEDATDNQSGMGYEFAPSELTKEASFTSSLSHPLPRRTRAF